MSWRLIAVDSWEHIDTHRSFLRYFVVCQLLRGCPCEMFFFSQNGIDMKQLCNWLWLMNLDELYFSSLWLVSSSFFGVQNDLWESSTPKNSAMGCTKTAGPLAVSKWYATALREFWIWRIWSWWSWRLAASFLFVTEVTFSILKNRRYDFDSSMGFSRLLETASRNGG